MPVPFRRSIFTRMCTSSFGVSAMSGNAAGAVTQPAAGPGESWSDGEGCWSGPVTFPAAVTQADPRASRSARAHPTLPTGRAGAQGAVTRSSGQAQAPGHPPAPGSRGKRTERTGRCRTMPAAAADSLIPAAMRPAQWSWSRLQAGCCRTRRLHGGREGGTTARVLRRAPQLRVVRAIRFGGTCRKAAAGSALSNKYRMQAAVRSKLPHRPMHRRAAPPSAGAVTQRSGSTWSIRSGGLPPAGTGVS